MNIAALHSLARLSGAPRRRRGAGAHSRAFTLLEVLLALIVLAIVLVVVHSIFYSALQLRNKADAAISDAIPLQHTLTVIRRDLENVTVPGGTLSGSFQTTLTTGSSMSSTHAGQQCGPTLYTTAGTLNDNDPWSEMRKVTYYLMPSTNGSAGQDLVRSVTRNLLPVFQEEYTDERLMSNVDSLTFQYYDGSQWMDTWDSASTSTTSASSTTSTNRLPTGVRVDLTLVVDKLGSIAPNPIEMVVPIAVQVSTNTTASTGGVE